MLKSRSFKYLGFLFFFLLNFCLKIPHLTDYPLAIDEPLSTYFPLFDLVPLFKYFTTTQTAPLYDIIMHFWIKITGVDSLFWLRVPSLIFSCFTAGLLFLTGMRFFNREIGIGSASLFVVSNIQVHFGLENRPYALFTLLSLLCLYYFLSYAQSREKLNFGKKLSTHYVPMVVLHAALVYTHYFGFFVLGIELFACLVFKEISRDKLKFWFLVYMGVGVTFLPIAYYVARTFYSTAVLGHWWLKAPETSEEVWYVLRQYTNSYWGTIAALTIMCTGYIFCTLKNIRLAVPEKILLLFFPLAWLGMLSVAYLVPIFLDRYTLYITPAFYLLVVLNLQRLAFNPFVRYGTAALLIGLFSIYNIPSHDRKRHVPNLIQKVNELKTPETLLYICPGWFDINYIYYTDQDLFLKKLLRADLEKELFRRSNIRSIFTREMVDEKSVEKADQILLLDFKSYEGLPKNGILEKLKSLKGKSFEEFDFQELKLYRLK
jgi:mannosyltransferase